MTAGMGIDQNKMNEIEDEMKKKNKGNNWLGGLVTSC